MAPGSYWVLLRVSFFFERYKNKTQFLKSPIFSEFIIIAWWEICLWKYIQNEKAARRKRPTPERIPATSAPAQSNFNMPDYQLHVCVTQHHNGQATPTAFFSLRSSARFCASWACSTNSLGIIHSWSAAFSNISMILQQTAASLISFVNCSLVIGVLSSLHLKNKKIIKCLFIFNKQNYFDPSNRGGKKDGAEIMATLCTDIRLNCSCATMLIKNSSNKWNVLRCSIGKRRTKIFKARSFSSWSGITRKGTINITLTIWIYRYLQLLLKNISNNSIVKIGSGNSLRSFFNTPVKSWTEICEKRVSTAPRLL